MSVRRWGEAAAGPGDSEDRVRARLHPAASGSKHSPTHPKCGSRDPTGTPLLSLSFLLPTAPGFDSSLQGNTNAKAAGKDWGRARASQGGALGSPLTRHRQQQGRAGDGSRQEQALVPFLMTKQIALQIACLLPSLPGSSEVLIRKEPAPGSAPPRCPPLVPAPGEAPGQLGAVSALRRHHTAPFLHFLLAVLLQTVHFFFSTSCSAASLARFARIPKRRALARAMRRLAKALKFFSSSVITRAFSRLKTWGERARQSDRTSEAAREDGI